MRIRKNIDTCANILDILAQVYCTIIIKAQEETIMKKTIDLVNEVMTLGFDREEALEGIDASLDNEVGFENRKPLMEEEIREELYESILEGFREEAEA